MLDRSGADGAQPATVRYLEADFQILVPGSYVICAITGQHIALDELKYWNSNHQEAYAHAQASLEAYQKHLSDD